MKKNKLYIEKNNFPLIVDFAWNEMDAMLDSGLGSGMTQLNKMFEALSKRIYDRYKWVIFFSA